MIKKRYQFALSKPAACDIEREPSLFQIDMDAPGSLLLFVACHLDGTCMSISRAYLKFADGVDQHMIEMHRPVWEEPKVSSDNGPEQDLRGTTLKVKKSTGGKKDVKTNKPGNAAFGS